MPINVRQQPHYTHFKIQPAVYIGMNRMDFLEGNVIKYVSRYKTKNGMEDLEKAKHYLDMLIQRERGELINPEAMPANEFSRAEEVRAMAKKMGKGKKGGKKC